MKVMLKILLIILSINLYASEELLDLIYSEIGKIMKNDLEIYFNEDSKARIERIHNLMINFYEELLIYLEKGPKSKEKDLMINRIFLAIRDFDLIMKNHNIDYLSKEIKTLIDNIENSYKIFFTNYYEHSLNFEKKYLSKYEFCIDNMKKCSDVCWKPPKIYMKSFHCNIENTSFNCECGQK